MRLTRSDLERTLIALVHLRLAKFGRQIRLSLAAFGLAVFTCEAQAPEDLRVALVIGNAAYAHAPVLLNAANDARAMNAALTRLGFKVIQVVDADMSTMNRAIEQMQSIIKGKQAVAMFYFAGHGLQLDWRNYLMPVEVELKNAADVQRKTIDVEQVLTTFRRSATRMNVIVLDACRDNPFASSSGSKGLAQVDAPPGTYLAFATAPGNVAEDGDALSGNGLFTQFLLKELQRPASIESVFKRVRLQVRQKSQGRQIPWDSSSLEEEFAFNDGRKFTLTAEDLKRDLDAARDREDSLKRAAQEAIEREKQLVLERERELLRLTQAKQIQEEQTRIRAEIEARERAKALAQAAQEEGRKALAAQEALNRAQREEIQRQRDIEIANAQTNEEDKLRKASEDKRFEIVKADWDKIKDSRNVDDFYAFLQKYPNTSVSKAAEVQLAMLAESSLRVAPGKDGILTTVKPTERFQLGDVYHWVSKHPETGQVYKRGIDKVVKISDLSVELSNGEVYSRNGAIQVIRMGGSLYKLDPAQVFFPPEDFKVGDGWRTESLITYGLIRLKTSGLVKVFGKETISIEAGSYETYKISIKGENSFEKMEMTAWLHPDFGRAVKTTYKSSRGANWTWEWARHPREKS